MIYQDKILTPFVSDEDDEIPEEKYPEEYLEEDPEEPEEEDFE